MGRNIGGISGTVLGEADKVIFMADGIIEEMGTPSEVFGDPKSEKTKAFLCSSFEKI